jgi:hypothetical protein
MKSIFYRADVSVQSWTTPPQAMARRLSFTTIQATPGTK